MQPTYSRYHFYCAAGRVISLAEPTFFPVWTGGTITLFSAIQILDDHKYIHSHSNDQNSNMRSKKKALLKSNAYMPYHLYPQSSQLNCFPIFLLARPQKATLVTLSKYPMLISLAVTKAIQGIEYLANYADHMAENLEESKSKNC